MILSACSSYFEQLFINFNEPHQVVILKDTSFADIVAIVEFMYKGEINVSQVKTLQPFMISGKFANCASSYGSRHLRKLLSCPFLKSQRCKDIG